MIREASELSRYVAIFVLFDLELCFDTITTRI